MPAGTGPRGDGSSSHLGLETELLGFHVATQTRRDGDVADLGRVETLCQQHALGLGTTRLTY